MLGVLSSSSETRTEAFIASKSPTVKLHVNEPGDLLPARSMTRLTLTVACFPTSESNYNKRGKCNAMIVSCKYRPNAYSNNGG